jgi:hypothetical protein
MEKNQTMKDLTPKDKAEELYDKMDVIHYMKLHGKNKDSKGLPISMHHDQIKQCAKNAVDFLLEELFFENEPTYWQEVKSEIEKL